MLPYKHRFHGHGSLRYTYRNGVAVRSHLATIKYVKNPRRHDSRFAVVVSKKVHKGAVGRNRIRRRIYECLRHELPLLKAPYDIVVIVVSSELRTTESIELVEHMRTLLDQANLYK